MSVDPDEYTYVRRAASSVEYEAKNSDTKIPFRRCVMVSNSNHDALASLIRASYPKVKVDVHQGLMWEYVCVSAVKK
jgi:hypothetical protein